MNKSSAVFLGAVILSLTFSQCANAAFPNLVPSTGPYMTTDGSLTPRTTFGLNETPFTYLQFNRSDVSRNFPLLVNWIWHHEGDPISGLQFKSVFTGNDPIQIWNSLDNWNLKKKIGDWDVSILWANPTASLNVGGFGNTKLSFTVTPEPLSTILFLAGGTPLALRLYSRRRQKRIKT